MFLENEPEFLLLCDALDFFLDALAQCVIVNLPDKIVNVAISLSPFTFSDNAATAVTKTAADNRCNANTTFPPHFTSPQSLHLFTNIIPSQLSLLVNF